MLYGLMKFNAIDFILYLLSNPFFQINLNQLPFAFQIIKNNVYLYLNINGFS